MAEATCPTCGQFMPSLTAAQVLAVLRREPRDSQYIYLTSRRGWAITRGGGDVARSVVEELRRAGDVVPRYPEEPEIAFCLPEYAQPSLAPEGPRKRLCTASGCSDAVVAQDLCMRHYQQQRRAKT